MAMKAIRLSKHKHGYRNDHNDENDHQHKLSTNKQKECYFHYI